MLGTWGHGDLVAVLREQPRLHVLGGGDLGDPVMVTQWRWHRDMVTVLSARPRLHALNRDDLAGDTGDKG